LGVKDYLIKYPNPENLFNRHFKQSCRFKFWE